MRRITDHGYRLPEPRGHWFVNVYADGRGIWHAEVRRADADGQNRGILSTDKRLLSIARQTARRRIIEAITEREQRTDESFAQAQLRVRGTLGKLSERVIFQTGSRVRFDHIIYTEETQ